MEGKLKYREAGEAISMKQETSPSLNIYRRGIQFLKFMIFFWKTQDKGRHLRQLSEDDQSVAMPE